MVGGGQAQGVEEGGQGVDGFHQTLVHGAAADIGAGTRVAHDQRNTHRRLQQEFFFTEEMIAEEVAVVAGKHDQRVVPAASALQKIKQPPELIVDLFDQPHVGGDHREPHLVAGKIYALLVLAECPVHRVIAGVCRLNRCLYMLGTVQRVIRRRRDVGPVRLDI